MKVTDIELHTASATDFVTLSYRDLKHSNPYNIKNVSGLDAEDIISRYYPASGPFKYYNLALPTRTIVLNVSMNPRFSQGETYSDLREALYKKILYVRQATVSLWFKNGATTVARVYGFIKKIEAPFFEKSPEVTITIECPDPMLKAPAAVNIDVNGLDPNNTLISDFLSTAPHGFWFQMTVLTAGDLTYTWKDPNDANWSFTVTVTSAFQVNDIIQFSSEYGQKRLTLTRSGVTTSLANKIIPGSVWPILFPGDNRIQVSNPTHLRWGIIQHTPTYWGI